VVPRGERLDDLIARSGAPPVQSKMFLKTAKKVRLIRFCSRVTINISFYLGLAEFSLRHRVKLKKTHTLIMSRLRWFICHCKHGLPVYITLGIVLVQRRMNVTAVYSVSVCCREPPG
jgi:hypothetical protein